MYLGLTLNYPNLQTVEYRYLLNILTFVAIPFYQINGYSGQTGNLHLSIASNTVVNQNNYVPDILSLLPNATYIWYFLNGTLNEHDYGLPVNFVPSFGAMISYGVGTNYYLSQPGTDTFILVVKYQDYIFWYGNAGGYQPMITENTY